MAARVSRVQKIEGGTYDGALYVDVDFDEGPEDFVFTGLPDELDDARSLIGRVINDHVPSARDSRTPDVGTRVPCTDVRDMLIAQELTGKSLDELVTDRIQKRPPRVRNQ